MADTRRSQRHMMDRDVVGKVLPAVVQIVALRRGMMGNYAPAWTGSGTIVDPRGIILTNCHVANPHAMGMSAPAVDYLAVAITQHSDEPPALTYLAEIVAQSPELDLAVLQIRGDLQGRPATDLALPFIEVGDSDGLELGDVLSIFGYPGIGGETVTFTQGAVAGFAAEQAVRVRRGWIKTDATIAGGNSGGTAVDQEGYLVGVPTQAAAGNVATPVDARPVVDTNRDGRIDERDTPMAVGGFINGLRPINLAKPLLQQAGASLTPQPPLPHGERGSQSPTQPSPHGERGSQSPTQPPPPRERGSQSPTQPSPPGERGSQSPSQPPPPGERGSQSPTQPPPPRERGSQAPSQPQPHGEGGSQSPSQPPPHGERGSQAPSQPRFSTLLFSERVTEDGRPVCPLAVLPSGESQFYVSFDYEGMQDGQTFGQVWAVNGQIIASNNSAWTDGASGRKVLMLSNEQGLPDGAYHLILSVNGQTVAEGEVVVGRREGDTDSEISGIIYDGATGQPIEGALVVALQPGASVQAFLELRDKSMVFTTANSDDQGRFVFPDQLPRGQAYGLVVAARGYQPLTVESALRVGPDAPEQAELNPIPLMPA